MNGKSNFKFAVEAAYSPFPATATGGSEGESINPTSARILPVKVEFMAHCFVCEAEQQFVFGWESNAGLIGCCLGCGDPRLAPWTRTTAA